MALPAAAAPAADRRPDGVLRTRDPRLQAAVGVRATTSGKPVRRPRRNSRSRWPTGSAYVELGLSRGLDIEEFAPGLSFFFDAHIDFFEEIAKFRAARRIWARWLRDVYGARTERAQWLRFHTQTAGVSLTAQQPDNNVVRTAIEALAAVLGGTNSLHTNALDEVLALPSEKAAEIALRTQQVIMEETGVVNVADPLGGSWYVESLTDRLEAEAEGIFARIKAMSPDSSMTGGILRGIEEGWFMGEIAEAAFAYQRKVEKGDKRMVGVNCHPETVGQPVEILRVSHEVERVQVRELAAPAAGPRPGGRGRSARRDARGGPVRREHDPGHAGRRQGRGDARRDLRRAAGRSGAPTSRPPRSEPSSPAAVLAACWAALGCLAVPPMRQDGVMQQQPRDFSLHGAVDLAARQAAQRRQAARRRAMAPTAEDQPGNVIEVTDATFNAMVVERSRPRR